MSKRAFIKSYGCQMNVYDATRMADQLTHAGYTMTDAPDGADLIVLNTCHIREKAAEKVYSELGRLKAEGGIIGVAGCVAQAEGEEIIRRQPRVDFVVGPQAYHRLPAVIADAEAGKSPVETDLSEDKFAHLPAPNRKAVTARGVTAFLTAQEGCDKFCAFCVVPYTRGAEVSRPVAEIVAEAKAREPRNRGQLREQFGQRSPARAIDAVISVDVLAKQRDFAHAGLGEA
ncbi:MAG: hypothetical protein AAFW98_08040, partial [Pseudomonadota bacterium]